MIYDMKSKKNVKAVNSLQINEERTFHVHSVSGKLLRRFSKNTFHDKASGPALF